MESFNESSFSKIGGCTVRATNKVSKTALKIQKHTQYTKATRGNCCKNLQNGATKSSTTEEQQQQQHIVSNKHMWWLLDNSDDNKNTNKIKIATNNNERPFTLLLLIAMTLAIIAQQQQTAAAAAVISLESSESSSSSLSQEEAAAAAKINELSHLASLSGNTAMRRTRLRKRHSNYLFFHNNMHESSTALEWENPCGGIFVQRDENVEGFDDGMMRPPVRHYMKILRRVTSREYRSLNESQQVININDIADWRLHKYHYKFLPNLKKNSSIALKRWYRNMQTYVASFAFLGRTQYKWDRSKLMEASKTSQELNELLMSARRILCEIETAINGSYPQGHNKLNSISREEMNKRLKFRTRRHHAHSAEVVYPEEIGADSIDLRFAKYSYYDYISTMVRILRKNARRAGQVNSHGASSMDHGIHSVEENDSMSLRAFSDLSASSSESLGSIENRSQSRSASRSRNGSNRRVIRRQQPKSSAELPLLNEI